jgi:hypothetical protein
MSNITTKPINESRIPLNTIPVTFAKNNVNYNCISSNLLSTNCGLNSNDNNSNCVAYCPTLPSTTRPPNKLLKFVPNPLITNSPSSSKSSVGSWSNNTLSDYPSNNQLRTMAGTTINFTDTDNTNLSCFHINAGSANCPTSNTFGCKAFCIKPNGNNFIIKQQCKLNPTSCNKSDLIWVKE